MKIKKIDLKDGTNFVVGYKAGEPDNLAPTVKSIAFYDQGAYSENKSGNAVFKGYKGPCYIVSCTDTVPGEEDYKTIIPQDMVKSVTVDSEKTKKSEPQGDEAIAQAEIDNLPAE